MNATPTTFDWRDPLLLESQLSEEERMIRDSVHEFAQNRLMPLIVEWNRHEIFDPDLMLEFGEMGFLGGTLECPSSKHLGRLSLFRNRGSGPSWFDVKPLVADGSSGVSGWSVS